MSLGNMLARKAARKIANKMVPVNRSKKSYSNKYVQKTPVNSNPGCLVGLMTIFILIIFIGIIWVYF